MNQTNERIAEELHLRFEETYRPLIANLAVIAKDIAKSSGGIVSQQELLDSFYMETQNGKKH